ncbi:hypothetical protein BH09PLA1_BH09PLA1_00330 [soil metagenome]
MHLDYEYFNPRGRMRRADMVSSEPGRVFKSVGTVRAAADPRTDPHDVEVDRFARQLADALAEAPDQNFRDKLAIVAAPRFLGALRRALGTQTRKHLIACMATNLSRENTVSLPEQLREALPDFFSTDTRMTASH